PMTVPSGPSNSPSPSSESQASESPASEAPASSSGFRVALEVRGLRHRFGDFVAVDGIDLSINRGEVFGLLGPNGAGKTTTIRVVNTLLPLEEGTVEVLGRDVRRQPMAVRRLLGYVPQQLSIEAALSGRENVSWFARLFDVPRAERRERVDDALAAMGLAEAANRMAGTYSGGMIRRLELAQALVNRPSLLVLDEPTVGLDPVAGEHVGRCVPPAHRGEPGGGRQGGPPGDPDDEKDGRPCRLTPSVSRSGATSGCGDGSRIGC